MKYLAIVAIAFLTACGSSSDKPTTEEPKKDEPLVQSKNSSGFNGQFENFLQNYYQLKDAFVSSDANIATSAANVLAKSADSLNLKEIKADNSIVEMANGYVQTVSSESKALAGEKDIEAKRKSFQMISDAMYDLVRTVRFDKEIVYHQFCPMAFNDAGAYWLSPSADIKNPYFGKKMLTCGEVKDSIDFRGK
jgi:uncharacterized protein YdbL (DUF1318 family)